jgi:hypothetical protein
MALRVVQPFSTYETGDEIDDPAVLVVVLTSDLSRFVVPNDVAVSIPNWEATSALIAIPSVFSPEAAQDTLITVLPDPFAGLGLGTTSFTTFGSVPAQLELSGHDIVVGSAAVSAGASYSIGIIATSGDGKRMVGETLTFQASSSGTLDFSTPEGTGLGIATDTI